MLTGCFNILFTFTLFHFMLLCIDIGNSAIKFGFFDGDKLTQKLSIPTDRTSTAAAIPSKLDGELPRGIEAAIACSVVPEAEEAVSEFVRRVAGVEIQFVRSSDDFGLSIDFDVTTTGTDRLVNSFAASEKYGVPCIVVSFGTATTIDVVNSKREYLGGLIAPGMKVNAQALAIAAAKLPEVSLEKPAHVIAQTTETAIQSGIVSGHIEMIKGLLRRVSKELGDKPLIVATGGWAEMMAAEIDQIDTVDLDLLLNGLSLIVKQAVSDRFDGRPSA